MFSCSRHYFECVECSSGDSGGSAIIRSGVTIIYHWAGWGFSIAHARAKAHHRAAPKLLRGGSGSRYKLPHRPRHRVSRHPPFAKILGAQGVCAARRVAQRN